MATDTHKTAHEAHNYSFSIIAVVAGLVTALAIFAALLIYTYDGRDDFSAAPTTISNAIKASHQSR
jgi:hypothetical protein